MADDLDVEALLEAAFRNKYNNGSDSDTKSQTTRSSPVPNKNEFRNGSSDGVRESADKAQNSHGERRRDHKRSKSRERHDLHVKKRDRSRSRDRQQRKASSPETREVRVSERAERRDRERRRDGDRKDRRRSRSKDKGSRRRSRSPARYRARSPETWTNNRDSWSTRRRSRSSSREGVSMEDRDQRTVFCMHLGARVASRDLEKFFSSVGKVREVRLIMDNKTRRHKGIAYVEFKDLSSVPLALALNGEKLCGVPLNIQPTQAEKNRIAAAMAANNPSNSRFNSRGANGRPPPGPTRLYVGSLHFNITEDMLRGIFEPFGSIEKIEIMRDPLSGRSRGHGFITFDLPDDAKKALDALNGFELAGRPMKVNAVATDRSVDSSVSLAGASILDGMDDTDRAGINLGSHGRLALMAKLAEGTGIELPTAAAAALKLPQSGGLAGLVSSTNGPHISNNSALSSSASISHSIATQCFMLTNMFDPSTESEPHWADEIRNDVLDECLSHGDVYHIKVDERSPSGNVYVKCGSVESASACVNALHGRWFSGRLVTAAYVPLVSYHTLFPDSVSGPPLSAP